MKLVAPLILLALGIGFLLYRPGSPPDGRTFDRIAPLATATLEPGQGLGELRLGESTLGWILRRHGRADVATLHADEVSGIELRYAGRQLICQFVLPNAQAYALDPPLRDMVLDPETYVSAHAVVRDAVLQSVCVCASPGGLADWYVGSLGPIALGCDLEPIARFAGVEDALSLRGTVGPLHAGVSPDAAPLSLVLADKGVELRVFPPPPLTDEELQQLRELTSLLRDGESLAELAERMPEAKRLLEPRPHRLERITLVRSGTPNSASGRTGTK
jgi:hypothetical protein